MAVAFDAFTAIPTAVDPSGTHTPVGTPRGALVFVQHPAAQSIVSITYGGTSMGSPVASAVAAAVGETIGSQIDAYLLGSSVPTGAQTVAVNGGATAIFVWVYTLTADGDVEFVDDGQVDSASVTDPTVTVSLSGRTSFVAEAYNSGASVLTNTTPFTNWTSRDEQTVGSESVGSYSYDIIGTTDVSAGLTQTLEDMLLLAVAVSEVVSGTVLTPSVGSTPTTGQTLGLGFAILMPDVT